MTKELERLQSLLDQVEYRYDLKFKVKQGQLPNIWCIKSIALVECAYKRDGSKIELLLHSEFHITDIEQIILNFNDFVRKIIHQIEMHEIGEWLLINKVRVFDPH